jgi:hypothetical protein
MDSVGGGLLLIAMVMEIGTMNNQRVTVLLMKVVETFVIM